MHGSFYLSDSTITIAACRNSFQPNDYKTGFQLLIFQSMYAKQFTAKAEKASSTVPSAGSLRQDSFSLQIMGSDIRH